MLFFVLLMWGDRQKKAMAWVGDTKISTQVYNIFSRQDKKKIS